MRFPGSGFFALLLLVGAGTARAQDTAADLSVRAAEVQADYCAEIYGGNVESAVAGYTEVAAIWGELKAAQEVDPQPVLLYWSGLMAQCLGQNERSIEDLAAFLKYVEAEEKAGNRGLLRPMKRDAERRLVRMDVAVESDPETANLTLVSADALKNRRRLGVALMVAGGATAVVGFSVDATIYAGIDVDEGMAAYNEDRQAEIAMILVGSVGAAVGVTGLIVAITRPRDQSHATLQLTPGPVTTLSVRF